jgi:glycosyltransferase involved in cell wall biosynthesis
MMDYPECEKFPGALRDLCEGRGRDGRRAPPQRAVEAFRAKEGLWPLGSSGGPGSNLRAPGSREPRSIAVILICHNYGRFLSEAIESVLAQTRAADEILIVDDSSTDDTPQVAATYSDSRVRYLRVSVQNVHQARHAGFESTTSEIVCFLDADDRLGPEYLACGLAQFSDPRIAVVYSDIEVFGNQARRSHYLEAFDANHLQCENFLHAGSLVRRTAIDVSLPFDVAVDPLQTQADWFLWRRVLVGNWTARKQSGTYFYRQHVSNWMHRMRQEQSPLRYFDYAGLAHETMTLFIPLSGRHEYWPRMIDFLQHQRWPHRRMKIILVDTSQDEAFHQQVRDWISRCDYADVRHIVHTVEQPGLADEPRNDKQIRQRVVKAMWRIYGLLNSVLETEYVWVLEDDLLPPEDACEQLLRGFDARTASVSAAYQSRFHGRYSAWDEQAHEFTESGTGRQVIGGNGFGCVILRRSVIGAHPFTTYMDLDDYDIAFYRRLAETPFVAKVDWDCVCQHGHETARPPLWQQVVNFGGAVVRHAMDGLKKVDETTYAGRLEICGECPSCDTVNWVCRDKSCGCALKIKAGWRSESCPQGRWADVARPVQDHPPSDQLSNNHLPNNHPSASRPVVIAPVPNQSRGWEGSLAKKPSQYRVTAAIPVIDTVQPLPLVIATLRLQTERPYIVLIDTGSHARRDQIEALRDEDVEIHWIRSHGWRHPSEPVTAALDLVLSFCQTPYLFCTHSDCFLKRRELLEELVGLCREHKAVGYQLSPRRHSDWEWMLGHTCSMFEIATLDRLNAAWSVRRLCNNREVELTPEVCGPNWPDTELNLNYQLHEAGIQPKFIGSEQNFERTNDENIDHCRSLPSAALYASTHHQKASQWMLDAIRQAERRIELWRNSP